MPHLLTEAQVKSFYRQGYVLVKDVFAKDELTLIRNTFKEAFEKELWRKSIYDSKSILNDIYMHFPKILNSIFNDKYIRAVKDILGESLVCIPECAVHHNRYYDWHRDTTRMEQFGDYSHLEEEKVLVQSAI